MDEGAEQPKLSQGNYPLTRKTRSHFAPTSPVTQIATCAWVCYRIQNTIACSAVEEDGKEWFPDTSGPLQAAASALDGACRSLCLCLSVFTTDC